MPKRNVGIFGVKRSSYLGPFGSHSDELPSDSDSSDSDYNPANRDAAELKPPTKKQKISAITDEILGNDGGELEKSKSFVYKQGDEESSQIPIETLVKIYEYLLLDDDGLCHICRAARVCRQWSRAAQFPLLWKKVNLSFLAQSRTAKDSTLISLIRRFPTIEDLNVNGWKKITNAAIAEMVDGLPNLQGLNIGYCTESDTSKRKVKPATLRQLVKKRLFHRVDFSAVFTDSSALKDLIEKSKDSLTHISLADCKCIGSGQLNLIQSHCQHLRALDLSKTSVEIVCIERLQAGCPNLEELYLTNLCIVPSRNPPEGPEFSEGFPKLKALSLGSVYGAYGISDSFLKRILHSSKELKILDLRGCTNISRGGLVELPAMPLERLFMGRCRVDRDMLYTISTMWQTTLTELDLSRTVLSEILPRSSDENIEFKRLRTLDLTGSLVTDEDVSYLLSRCQALTSVDLTLCRSISRGLKMNHDSNGITNLKRNLVDWQTRL